MRRRAFLAGAALLACPRLAAAQSASPARIGLLSVQDPGVPWLSKGLRAGLDEHGYVEGRNIEIEYRWARGDFAKLPAMAAELAALKPDLIIAVVTQASIAAAGATRTTPIVTVGIGDPVAVGLAASLAKPGGNVTGTSAMTPDLVGKQLELLREVAGGTRFAVMWNPANAPFQALQIREAEAAGRAFDVELQFLAVSGPEGFEPALAAMRRDGLGGVLVLVDPVYVQHRHSLAALFARERLPAVSGARDFAEAGGIATYGPSYFHAARRAVAYVDRILKGAKPGELPIEQPTNFELVVNLKTARAMRLAIPDAILARADAVIE